MEAVKVNLRIVAKNGVKNFLSRHLVSKAYIKDSHVDSIDSLTIALNVWNIHEEKGVYYFDYREDSDVSVHLVYLSKNVRRAGEKLLEEFEISSFPELWQILHDQIIEKIISDQNLLEEVRAYKLKNYVPSLDIILQSSLEEAEDYYHRIWNNDSIENPLHYGIKIIEKFSVHEGIIIDYLSKGEDDFKEVFPFVAEIILKHPNCPLSVVDHFKSHTSYGLIVAKNPRASKEILSFLFYSDSHYMFDDLMEAAIAKHPNCPDDILEEIQRVKVLQNNISHLSSQSEYLLIVEEILKLSSKRNKVILVQSLSEIIHKFPKLCAEGVVLESFAREANDQMFAKSRIENEISYGCHLSELLSELSIPSNIKNILYNPKANTAEIDQTIMWVMNNNINNLTLSAKILSHPCADKEKIKKDTLTRFTQDVLSLIKKGNNAQITITFNNLLDNGGAVYGGITNLNLDSIEKIDSCLLNSRVNQSNHELFNKIKVVV